MSLEREGPLKDWILYVTNHFTHLVVESQTASPRHHLARKLSEKGQKLLVYCPLGTHRGNPFQDFLTNLRPRRTVKGNITYLFPPLLVSPTSVGTVLTLVLGTLFILLYLRVTRLKVSAQYCTTILVGSVSAVVRMVLKIPLVANYGDPDFAREFGLARRAFGFCEDLVMTRRNAYAIVYVDEVVGSYVRSNFPVKKTLFLPNGGYEAGFEPPAPDSPEVVAVRKQLGLEGRSIIAYTGQLTSVYRLDMLVAAAPSIIASVPNVAFLIIGGGPTLSVLQKSVRQAGLDKYFVFTGSLPYESLGKYLINSDLCVQLLNDWCMGTKVFMYMVHRRAIIAGGNWFNQYGQFLRNGENLILIPPNTESFTAAAIKVLKDPELRTRLGRAAREAALPYTWDRHADDTLRLLRESFTGEGRTTFDDGR